MKNNFYMTIKEFSHLTGIKKENLRYYNSIGLLEPVSRGDNGYRYYSRSQLSKAYLIVSLRELGVGIADIKKYINIRTPQEMFSLFKIQKDNILEEINKLQSILDIMKLYIESKYYFKMGKYNNDYKPEGKYVVLYGRCAYGESKVLYEKLFDFIKENNLTPLANIYEEYPINEISTLNEEDYCIKLEVPILDKN